MRSIIHCVDWSDQLYIVVLKDAEEPLNVLSTETIAM